MTSRHCSHRYSAFSSVLEQPPPIMPALRTLAEGGQSPKVDIVAVHGLNPSGKDVKQHAWDTWRKPSGDKGNVWLRDILPKTLTEARIFLYEYDSKIFSGKHETFWDAGNEFLDCLRGKRQEEPRRPLILVGHSLGGLLIKQALVNAHDNSHYSDIEASVKSLMFFSTPHEGGNKSSTKVSLGFTAAKSAKFLGFNDNDSIVQVLTPGSLFSDFLRESFRHQLENYLIVSFWEKKSTIVTKESATFNLPGHRETILGLDANHSDMCRFNPNTEEDMDIYEFVKNNFRWLYDEALKERSLEARMEALVAQDEDRRRDNEILSQFVVSISTRLGLIRARYRDRRPYEDIDWVTNTSAFRTWSHLPVKGTSKGRAQFPIIWCKAEKEIKLALSLCHHVQEQGECLVYIDRDLAPLPALSMLKSVYFPHGAASLFLSLIFQAYHLVSGSGANFASYFSQSCLVEDKPRSVMSVSQRTAQCLTDLMLSDRTLNWILLINAVDGFESGLLSGLARLLERLLDNTSPHKIENLKVMAVLEDQSKIPHQFLPPVVIDKNTEYLECLASLKFDNMNLRRDRISSPTIGTNHWIWENKSYLEWRENAGSILWISGKPGSGKSVLAKTIQESFLADSVSSQTIVASWFYSARDNLTRHQQMFAAMLYQTLKSEPDLFFNCAKSMYRRGEFSHKQGATLSRLPLKESLQALVEYGARARKTFLLVIDGMDESNRQAIEEANTRHDVLKFFLQLTGHDLPLRFIVLSRPADDIQRALQNAYFLPLHEVNRPDIDVIIQTGVYKLSRMLDGYNSGDDEVVDSGSHVKSTEGLPDTTEWNNFNFFKEDKASGLSEIQLYMKENAKGVILWVTTVLKILSTRCNEMPFCDIETLKSELHCLPLELNSLYCGVADHLLESFARDPKSLRQCRRALMWVSVSAKNNFQLQDLLEVLSRDLGNDDITPKSTVLVGFNGWSSFKTKLERLCGPFIEVVPIYLRQTSLKHRRPSPWDNVQFPHETVRTFLQESNGCRKLGFSAAEAEDLVRTETKRYMRRAIIGFGSLLSSIPTYDPYDKCWREISTYAEERPLLSFTLTRIFRELTDMCEPSLLSTEATNGSLRLKAAMKIFKRASMLDNIEITYSSVTSRFPHISQLPEIFQDCGFLDTQDVQMLKKIAVNSRSDRRHWKLDEHSVLEMLFLFACSGGYLNCVNTLIILVYFAFRGDLPGYRKKIMDGVVQTASKADVQTEPPFSILEDGMQRNITDQILPRLEKELPTGFMVIDKHQKVRATIAQVHASGLLPTGPIPWEATSDLKSKLAKFLRTPFISMTVNSFGNDKIYGAEL